MAHKYISFISSRKWKNTSKNHHTLYLAGNLVALLALGDLLPWPGLGLLAGVSRGVSWVGLFCSLLLSSWSSLSSLALLLLLSLLLLPLTRTGRRCRKPISSSAPTSALSRLVGNYTGSRLQIYLVQDCDHLLNEMQ